MEEERRNGDGLIVAGLIGCLVVAVLLSLMVATFGVAAYQSFQAQKAEQEALEAQRAARAAAEAKQKATLPGTPAP
jgi:hypothetical protein